MSRGPGWKLRSKRRLHLMGDLQVMTFPSHGTTGWLRVKGRIIEAKGVAKAEEDAGVVANALNTLRRLRSDEIPGARVRAHYRGASVETTSDQEGYFDVRLTLGEPVEPGWHEVALEVTEPFDGDRLDGTAPVLVPRPDAEFAVVSDLDDTVIRTQASDLLGEVRMVFGRNARTRPPFRGVASLYRALERGPDGEGANPFFYVSLSGWNLYDLFEEFMEIHDIPLGAFFMTDLSIVEDASPAIAADAPKLERIAILMENYPELPFVLIGDSGQEDPETYRTVVDRHPGRVKAVYIRDMSPAGRDRQVQEIAEEVEAMGVPMVLARDSVVVAEHAVRLGLVPAGVVEEVREESERERQEDGEAD